MYIDQPYLNNAFGADQVAALCPTPEALATTIELAEADVESALITAGYSTAVPSTVYSKTDDVPKVIKLAAYGAWLVQAHGRRGIEVPQRYESFIKKLDAINSGRLEIPGLPKRTARAVGGFTMTESDPRRAGSVPAVFHRSRMGGF